MLLNKIAPKYEMLYGNNLLTGITLEIHFWGTIFINLKMTLVFGEKSFFVELSILIILFVAIFQLDRELTAI